MKKYELMTDAELNKEADKLAKILNYCPPADDEWSKAYKEYCKISAIQDERYRERNQEAFDEFYKKHIFGKSWEEISPEDWEYYSDWHKDMYGFRPRTI